MARMRSAMDLAEFVFVEDIEDEVVHEIDIRAIFSILPICT